MRDVIGCEGMCGGYANRWVVKIIVSKVLLSRFPVESTFVRRGKRLTTI